MRVIVVLVMIAGSRACDEPNARAFVAGAEFLVQIDRKPVSRRAREFASNSRAQANADEGKAVAQGTIAYYGTYTVNEAEKTVTYRVEGSTYPNLTGAEQKRTITSLTEDELKYTNPATSTGTKAEAVWRRAK